MTKERAQVGDLIRITNVPEGWAYEAGGIFEVDNVFERGHGHTRSGVNFSSPDLDEDERFYAYDDMYVIHRKAGEEEECSPAREHLAELRAEETEQDAEPSKWSDTRPNLIRLAATELADLLVRKNHDYGDSFSQQYAKYGLMSALIRMDDKMRRLETLQAGEQAQVSESVNDTLLDLAGYALLAYVEQSKK